MSTLLRSGGVVAFDPACVSPPGTCGKVVGDHPPSCRPLGISVNSGNLPPDYCLLSEYRVCYYCY